MTTTLDRPPVTPPPARSTGARVLTWTGGIVGGVLLLSGGYSALDLLVLGSDDARTTSATASYAAAPVVELAAEGDITVTTGGDRVEVQRAARTALNRARYRVDEGADRLSVTYDCSAWRPGFCSTSLDVTVPEGTRLVLRTSDGSVHATGLQGALDVRAADGSSTVSDVDGDVTVRTTDGRTQVTGVRGDVSVRTSDGSVSVEDVTGSVTAGASDGRIDVAGVRGDVDARASDGNVTVYGTGRPVALEISATDGRETVEGPVDPTSSTHVRIRTSDGDASYLRPRD